MIQAVEPADRILAIVNDSTDIVELTAAYNAQLRRRRQFAAALPSNT